MHIAMPARQRIEALFGVDLLIDTFFATATEFFVMEEMVS
ncbi:hypothetical protein Pla144_03790 [Bythopirellula polymerisocia]|uniref:Uncharacterized protein n=1 Tax=Bythopirellula polymerisocia TaxID=2528003 RepID=A0A5C6D1H8_9BACT|nr:hypothetical protein Pla144_03790 [Bythopirellula polymerisocia]